MPDELGEDNGSYWGARPVAHRPGRPGHARSARGNGPGAVGCARSGPGRDPRALLAAGHLAPPLEKHHVAPAAVVAPDPLAHAEDAEPARFVEREARGVLGEDPGLERPQPGRLGLAHHGLEERAPDAAPARGLGHVDALLGDPAVHLAPRDGGEGAPAEHDAVAVAPHEPR